MTDEYMRPITIGCLLKVAKQDIIVKVAGSV
jgi:hypothetical protein